MKKNWDIKFEELAPLFDSIPQTPGRLGIFRVKVNNWHKHYDFHNLKVNYSNNPDVFGFGLNHYGWLNLPMPKYKRSKFHDEEDVCIDITIEDFKNAWCSGHPEIVINTKTSNIKITWEI